MHASPARPASVTDWMVCRDGLLLGPGGCASCVTGTGGALLGTLVTWRSLGDPLMFFLGALCHVARC